MRYLNITYYFGQIREEFRGNNTLFMEVDQKKRSIKFKSFPLNSSELNNYTEKGVYSPMRAYIGVNSNAQPELEKRQKKGRLRDAHDLDIQIVREEIVNRRRGEVNDLVNRTMNNLIDSDK